MQYIVTSRVKSGSPTSEGVGMQWYEGPSLALAMAAMVQAAAMHDDDNDASVPEVVRVQTLDVHLAIRPDTDPTVRGICLTMGEPHMSRHTLTPECEAWTPVGV